MKMNLSKKNLMVSSDMGRNDKKKRLFKRRNMAIVLVFLLTAACVSVVNAEDIIEDDYIAIDCGDYEVLCDTSCYYSGGDASTAVYPKHAANTSVYVGATLYAKDMSNGRIVEYDSRTAYDTDSVDVTINITGNYIGDSTESVHEMRINFVDSSLGTVTDSYSLTAKY